MKRLITLTLTLCLVVSLASFCALFAEGTTYTGGYYTYTVENGEATIIGTNGSVSGALVIPSTLGGYPVTGIGEKAFQSETNVTSLNKVVIPNSVKSIGVLAFGGLFNLSSVTIGDGVEYIGDEAFGDCFALHEIFVSENNQTYSTVNGVLFNKDKSLLIYCPTGRDGKYDIPQGVTDIYDDAFRDCGGITRITIPRQCEEYRRQCI